MCSYVIVVYLFFFYWFQYTATASCFMLKNIIKSKMNKGVVVGAV